MFNPEGSNIVLKPTIHHCLWTVFNKCSAKIPAVLHTLWKGSNNVYCLLFSNVFSIVSVLKKNREATSHKPLSTFFLIDRHCCSCVSSVQQYWLSAFIIAEPLIEGKCGAWRDSRLISYSCRSELPPTPALPSRESNIHFKACPGMLSFTSSPD